MIARKTDVSFRLQCINYSILYALKCPTISLVLANFEFGLADVGLIACIETEKYAAKLIATGLFFGIQVKRARHCL